MTTNLQVVTTTAGQQAILDADTAGLKLKITHVAVGDAGYTPLASATALTSEKARVEIAHAEVDPQNHQLALSAAIVDDGEYWIREVGFFAEDGTLVWLWSMSSGALGYKTAPVRFLLGLTLTVTDVPLGAIQIVDQGQPLDLAIEPAIAESATAATALSAAFTDEGRRGLERDAEIRDIKEQLRLIGQETEQYRLLLERQVGERVASTERLAASLALSAASAAESQAEVLRANGQSGIIVTRQYNIRSKGEEPWYRPTTIGYAALNAHDHANLAGVMGLAELGMVVNGWYLRTRHNDYVDNTPAAKGSGYLAVRRQDPVTVPASVTGTPAEQITKMRNLLHKVADGSIADADAQHFRWDLAYAEVWWEVLPESGGVADAFYSPRHQADDTSAAGLLNTIQMIDTTGAKLRAENNPFVPVAVRSIRGRPQIAVLRYRILTRTVSTLKDHKISDMVAFVDDVPTRMRDEVPADVEGSRYARFALKTPDTWMEKIPGLDGAGATLLEEYFEDSEWKQITGWSAGTTLNAAYYSRRASLSVPDASGRTGFHRGFNDPTLWAALTTQERVSGFERDGRTYRASWAIPLELILRTPLESWNPYGIPEQTTITGAGTEASPYNGYRTASVNWFTPDSLFQGDAAGDDADTSAGARFALDAGGTARAVRASGVRIFLPPVPKDGGGTTVIRTRYPVHPVYHEGSPAYIEAMARFAEGA
ncbi:phage tail protein (plasmid) [Tistrella mobilis]|uniref:phage tail-collar fiber domain-containing protein n=1 Tax=Tistrella mobilis TaxID=171437 RepID=UPI0035578156